MKFKSTTTMLFLALLFAASTRAADKYAIDPVHSSITFSVKHFVISTVSGKFNDFSGTILYDENDLTAGGAEVILKTASIDTDNKRRDTHLKSADFFDAEKYPEIRFKSTGVQAKDSGSVLVGNLTLRGVTKEVSIPFTITGKITDPLGKTRIGLEGTLSLKRLDYGVAWSKKMDNGSLIVSNDVKITIHVEAVKR